ncbi:uncharacterized protein BDV17DRAFT_109096 [Aspergillus undulatus]|uniref:uncharacterized protein n=1 Tax=Aspergillus undulatus TaxID=1810928 RepID=UPI003CCD23D5
MLASLERLKSLLLLAIASDHLRLSMAIRSDVQKMLAELVVLAIDSQRRAIVLLSKEQKLIVDSLSLGLREQVRGQMDGRRVMSSGPARSGFCSMS